MYPGSFDPLHFGHLDIIEQAAELFGEVVVTIMYNFAKPSGMFPVEERVDLITESVAHLPAVSVATHSGLAIQAAEESGADFIVKGLRAPADFEIEQQMAHMNASVSGVRTVYVPCRSDLAFLSSRFVREIAQYGGDVGHLVPDPVARALAARSARDES
jgi:pantetheine-phosphate adenylyltransferase